MIYNKETLAAAPGPGRPDPRRGGRRAPRPGIIINMIINIIIINIRDIMIIIVMITIIIIIIIIISSSSSLFISIAISLLSLAPRPRRGRPAQRPRTAPWSRTSGVSTNGAAAEAMNFDRLGEKVHPGTFGNVKVG